MTQYGGYGGYGGGDTRGGGGGGYGQGGYSTSGNPFDDRQAASDGRMMTEARQAPARLPSGPRGGGGSGRMPSVAGYNPQPAAGFNSSQGYSSPSVVMGRDGYSNTLEMSSLTRSVDTGHILDEIQGIKAGVEQIDANLGKMADLQTRKLGETEVNSSTTQQLDNVSSDTMGLYRELVDRIRTVKSKPESRQARNAQQVKFIDGLLKEKIQKYQQVDMEYRKRSQEAMKRQYMIVRPDATAEEASAAVEDMSSNGTMFQQAVMQSGRRAQAQAVLGAVQDRHAEFRKIEEQLVELAELFQQMNELVEVQEEQIVHIEQQAEQVVEDLKDTNVNLGKSVETARSTRKKKWICLGIGVTIIVAIIAIVAVYFLVNKKTITIDGNQNKTNNPNSGAATGGGTGTGTSPGTSTAGKRRRSLAQRSVLQDLNMNTARSVPWGEELPVARIHARSKFAMENIPQLYN